MLRFSRFFKNNTIINEKPDYTHNKVIEVSKFSCHPSDLENEVFNLISKFKHKKVKSDAKNEVESAFVEGQNLIINQINQQVDETIQKIKSEISK